MKLKRDAVAALTIGPGMCKDKLMQAAFRMRQLDREQSLKLILPLEVVTQVQYFASKGSNDLLQNEDVLDWVLKNTVHAIKSGLPEWASQGSFFCTTKKNPKLRLLDENLALRDLYASSCSDAVVHDVVIRTQNRFRGRCQTDDLILNDLMAGIAHRSKKFGQDIFTKESCLDEECERELENERELEKEVEQELPLQTPITEQDWNYAKVFVAESPLTLPSQAGIISLETAICSLSPQFRHINWDKNVYMTENFMKTVGNPTSPMLTERQHFLRPVDAAIQFERSSTLLLLSEREADSILSLYWERQHLNQSFNNSFISLSFLKTSSRVLDSGTFPLQLRLCDSTTKSHMPKYLSSSVIASVQLFSGDTMFENEQALTGLLNTSKGKEVATSFTDFRDTHTNLARSDLEKVSGSDLKGEEVSRKEREKEIDREREHERERERERGQETKRE